MARRPSITTIICATAVVATVACIVLDAAGAFNFEVWTRENPLRGAISVTSVRDGTITLADGRSFRPAGVRRRESISEAEYNRALEVMVAQGVSVTRDLGDGRAFLLAEPKFYNSCGTRGHNGDRWAHWAGGYFQCPLSEALIQSGFAAVDLAQPGLTPPEAWRLEGAEHLFPAVSEPSRISNESSAFRYDPSVNYFAHYDDYVDACWKPCPSK